MRLAIASPNRDKYSETFIRLQLERLPCSLKIFGRPIATDTEPGGSLMRGGFRRMASLAVHGLRQGLSGGVVAWQCQELKRRLQTQEIDVVLANYGPTGVALQSICRSLSIPLVVHFHGFDAHMNAVVAANQEGYAELGRSAARVVVVSELMAESVVAAGIPRGKVRLLRYGVDSARFRSRTRSPRQPVFLGVGRFVDKKAPNLTVMAFKEVHRRFPNSRLVLAGDGLLLESTRNLAAVLGLGEAIEFPGPLTTDEVAERMSTATAFVQHSLTPQVGPSAGDCEGTPVAVLEAMMSGLPVVATRHAGIGEVIDHGCNGFLVEERDVQGMSNAMIRLAASPETSESMGRAARSEAMELYCAETYTDNLQRILESAARRDDLTVQAEEVFEPTEDHGLAESCRAIR